MTVETQPTTIPRTRRETARYVGAAAASVAAGLYLLIGLGVFDVGDSTAGGTPDLLAFGLMTGGTFALAALALLLRDSRLVAIAVAAWSLIVIVGYFAFAGVRTPPFEVWGLLVKACQLVVFGAAAYLAIRRPEEHETNA
jgi:peptidoglycan/LPS O-acetylase OafA/YrhL